MTLSFAGALVMASTDSPRRELKKLRRELVHAAGCVFRGRECCASIQVLDETLGDALALGVAIPRSLRARARLVWAQKLAASRGKYDALFEDWPSTSPTPEL